MYLLTYSNPFKPDVIRNSSEEGCFMALLFYSLRTMPSIPINRNKRTNTKQQGAI